MLSLSHAHSSMRLLEQKMRLLMYFCSSERKYVTVGWVRERCVYLSRFGKMSLMMEISSLNSLCAKHIHHPDNGGKANQSAHGVLPYLQKGKTLYAMRVRLHPGAILQKWRGKGVFFLLKFGKTNDPLQVSLIFMLVFLGWTSCPLRCLTGFYDFLCQHLCMSSKEHILCHLALTSLCCLLSELAKTEVQLPHY